MSDGWAAGPPSFTMPERSDYPHRTSSSVHHVVPGSASSSPLRFASYRRWASATHKCSELASTAVSRSSMRDARECNLLFQFGLSLYVVKICAHVSDHSKARLRGRQVRDVDFDPCPFMQWQGIAPFVSRSLFMRLNASFSEMTARRGRSILSSLMVFSLFHEPFKHSFYTRTICQ